MGQALLYRRVSTDEQGLGLAAQRERLREEAARRGWDAQEVTDKGVSGGVPVDERPALGPALDSLGPGEVLAVARLDRLSRSMLDFARLTQRASDGGWDIVALDLGIDMTTPNGRLVASILVAVAEWEREMIGQRIREGLAQSGKTLGRLPGMPKQGGAVAKPPPDTVLAAVEDLRSAGHSPRSIAARLNAHGHPTPRGGRWHRTTVRRLLSRMEAA